MKSYCPTFRRIHKMAVNKGVEPLFDDLFVSVLMLLFEMKLKSHFNFFMQKPNFLCLNQFGYIPKWK